MNSGSPLVSIVIFTYNQEQFIKDTLDGAFAQTYSPLEIIISDDCSTDNNFYLIQKAVENYSGPHQVSINRNETNLGIGDHVDYALRLTKGELIIIMGGDDISYPQRAEIIYNEWAKSNRSIMAFFSNVELIDKYGNSSGELFKKTPSYTRDIFDFIKKSKIKTLKSQPLCWLLGCSEAIDKRVLVSFEGINKNVIQEDAVLAFRALLLGKIKYIDKVLVKYRRHGKNIFEPNDVKKALKLLRNEYYYKLQWYNDSLKIKNLPESLNSVLKSELAKAYLFHIFINIPILGFVYQFSKQQIKNLLKLSVK